MKNIMSLLMLLLVAMSTIFFPSAHGDKTLIQTTCRKTPFDSLCVSVLQSDARSSTADVQGLAVIAADNLARKATDAMKKIRSLVKMDPRYKTCLDAYNIIVKYDVPEILLAVKGDPKFAEQGASDVGYEADSCGKSIRPFNSAVGDTNKFVVDWSAVVVSIVRLLL